MFEELLNNLARALDKHDIPYMVIGGQAVLVYGEPRLTRDIDITLGVNNDRLSTVLSLARSIGLAPAVDEIERFVDKTMVLPVVDLKSGIRVDFVFSFSPYERQAIKRARMLSVGKARVRFAAKEDIIIHKIFSGRPRDIDDVRSIMMKHKKINAPYIVRWLKQFDDSLGSRCLGEFRKLENEGKRIR